MIMRQSQTKVNSHLSITKLPCCRRQFQMSSKTHLIALFFVVTDAGSTSGHILSRPISAIPMDRCTAPLVGLDRMSAMLYSVGTRSTLPCPSSMISLMVKYFSFMCRFLGVIRHSFTAVEIHVGYYSRMGDAYRPYIIGYQAYSCTAVQ